VSLRVYGGERGVSF
jgi:hypothetical protein